MYFFLRLCGDLKIRNTVILSNSVNVMLCGRASTPLALDTEQMKKYLLSMCKVLFKLVPYPRHARLC